MRIAVMSDIHGNAIALRAVLADAQAFGVDAWWVLGDIVALGPDPVETIDIIRSLTNVQAIAGNTERYVLTGDLPYPSLLDVRQNPNLLERLVEVVSNCSWTRGAITSSGNYAWLASLGSQIRETLPDGTRVLAVHASPASDDGDGIDTRISDEDLVTLIGNCNADVVFAGHTHDVTDRMIGSIRAVNLGSVSNPTRADKCATYVILNADEDGYAIEHRTVSYDIAAVLARLDEVKHPAASYLKHFYG
jgi:putative phosphoesterase